MSHWQILYYGILYRRYTEEDITRYGILHNLYSGCITIKIFIFTICATISIFSAKIRNIDKELSGIILIQLRMLTLPCKIYNI